MNRISKTLPVFAFAVCTLMALPALGGMAEVGHKAPDFSLTDHNGKTHQLSDYEGKIVVLEWTNPGCPFVQRHYKDGNTTMIDLQTKYAEKDVVWMAVDSSNFVTAESASKWAEDRSIPYPILLDASGEVGQAYGAKTTPHMFVIGKDGKVVYAGAIDDDPRGESKSPMNYVAAALSATMKGDEIAHATTKPYGCSVKYGKAKEKTAASR